MLLARQFRDQYADEFKTQEGDDLQPERIVNPVVKNSEKAAEILHRNGLDGRDINRNLTGFATPNIAKIPLSAARSMLFLTLLPIFIISLLPQMILGRVLGDSTDEGIDARTSYQFLAAMFGSIIIWPISSVILVALMYWQAGSIAEISGFEWTESIGTSTTEILVACGLMWLLMFPISLFTGRLFSLVWDDYVDLRGYYRKQKVSNSDKQELFELIAELQQDLSGSD